MSFKLIRPVHIQYCWTAAAKTRIPAIAHTFVVSSWTWNTRVLHLHVESASGAVLSCEIAYLFPECAHSKNTNRSSYTSKIRFPRLIVLHFIGYIYGFKLHSRNKHTRNCSFRSAQNIIGVYCFSRTTAHNRNLRSAACPQRPKCHLPAVQINTFCDCLIPCSRFLHFLYILFVEKQEKNVH